MGKNTSKHWSFCYFSCVAGVFLIVALLILPSLLREPPAEFASRHAVSGVQPLPTLSPAHLLNTGDAAALDMLPGIGEVLAQRIIDMRAELDGYILPEELIFVKGIGEKKMADIRDALAEMAPQEKSPE